MKHVIILLLVQLTFLGTWYWAKEYVETFRCSGCEMRSKNHWPRIIIKYKDTLTRCSIWNSTFPEDMSLT